MLLTGNGQILLFNAVLHLRLFMNKLFPQMSTIMIFEYHSKYHDKNNIPQQAVEVCLYLWIGTVVENDYSNT